MWQTQIKRLHTKRTKKTSYIDSWLIYTLWYEFSNDLDAQIYVISVFKHRFKSVFVLASQYIISSFFYFKVFFKSFVKVWKINQSAFALNGCYNSYSWCRTFHGFKWRPCSHWTRSGQTRSTLHHQFWFLTIYKVTFDI